MTLFNPGDVIKYPGSYITYLYSVYNGSWGALTDDADMNDYYTDGMNKNLRVPAQFINEYELYTDIFTEI